MIDIYDIIQKYRDDEPLELDSMKELKAVEYWWHIKNSVKISNIGEREREKLTKRSSLIAHLWKEVA